MGRHFGRDRHGPKDLAGVSAHPGRQLEDCKVARPYDSARWHLRRYDRSTGRHRRGGEEADPGLATKAGMPGVEKMGQLILAHPGPRFGQERCDRGIAQRGGIGQPSDFLGVLDQPSPGEGTCQRLERSRREGYPQRAGQALRNRPEERHAAAVETERTQVRRDGLHRIGARPFDWHDGPRPHIRDMVESPDGLRNKSTTKP